MKDIDWNARMDDFARNLNGHFRQNRTLYAEERNVQKKEKYRPIRFEKCLLFTD